ncbi:MAG TPA: APC family permease [Chitinophagaceae bacterium]|nr:APC family permease [Chitinophagaceae bacterium]
MTELRRSLNLAQCVFFGVGSILGAGIYTLLGKVAGWSGNLVWVSLLISSFTAFCTATAYAELSALFPKAGGEYVYVKRATGRTLGTVLGLVISLNGIISGATVSVGFGGYLTELLPVAELLGALAIILVIFLVNVSGIRESSTMNIIFTIIEFSGLAFVIVAAFPYLGQVNLLEAGDRGWNGVFTAAALGFFAYIGFEEIVKLAEETKKPERNIPRALFIANAVVGVLYFFVGICAVSVIPWEELGQSSSPLADIVGSRFGKTAITAISIIALFATANTILSNMLGSSRVLLNMSREITWMKRFSKVSEKRRTPIATLVLIFFVMSAFALIGNIETIARIANLFIFVTFLFVNISVLVLRAKEKNLRRPYRSPLTIGKVPVLNVLAILLILVLLGFNVFALVG